MQTHRSSPLVPEANQAPPPRVEEPFLLLHARYSPPTTWGRSNRNRSLNKPIDLFIPWFRYKQNKSYDQADGLFRPWFLGVRGPLDSVPPAFYPRLREGA